MTASIDPPAFCRSGDRGGHGFSGRCEEYAVLLFQKFCRVGRQCHGVAFIEAIIDFLEQRNGFSALKFFDGVESACRQFSKILLKCTQGWL